jgi:hypothetical protein
MIKVGGLNISKTLRRFKQAKTNLNDSNFDFDQFKKLLKGHEPRAFTGAVTFNDPPGSTKHFSPHYEEHIRPHVKRFEEKRINALKSLKSRSIKSIVVFCLLCAAIPGLLITFEFAEGGYKILAILTLLAIVALVAFAYKPISDYRSEVKGLIYPEIFKYFGRDFVYDRKGPLAVKSLMDSEIIPSHDQVKKEDYIKGEHNGVKLEMMEATLYKRIRHNKRTETKVTFQGIMILLSMNKNFTGKTIVKRDVGFIGNFLNKSFSKYENVKLEDPVFEDKFEVYSSDQVEARYLLTTSFMERLLELSDVFGEGGIQCSFYNDRLLLLIPTSKNRFEASSVFKPATFVDDINMILKEMSLIFQIIEMLKLDEKTGL